ncbi:unnamed protein product, partial [Hydatigera taeniaeformis]|uniref:Cas1_AcylT domain-containing protein n=1 Tax=Hydatigena taeniaeformis TaxID=6205 RepID=A0A0R3WJ47_HYDTA
KYQSAIDRLNPYTKTRWCITFAFFALYAFRIYSIQVSGLWFPNYKGFHIISYALAIYILSLFIHSISPQVDPEFADMLGTVAKMKHRHFQERRPMNFGPLFHDYWRRSFGNSVFVCHNVTHAPLTFAFCLKFVLCHTSNNHKSSVHLLSFSRYSGLLANSRGVFHPSFHRYDEKADKGMLFLFTYIRAFAFAYWFMSGLPRGHFRSAVLIVKSTWFCCLF